MATIYTRNLSQTPPSVTTVEQVETISNEYLSKPLVVETTITKEKPIISHKFPYGWCTYWVATKRSIPWSGNANQWPLHASTMGYSVSLVPKEGAVMVEDIGSMGHVSYVESVDENHFTVSEMNYKGWGVVSYRTLSIGFRAKFIY